MLPDARDLTDDEKAGVSDLSAFLLKLLDCLSRLPPADQSASQEQKDEIRRVAEKVKEMAEDGRIDRYTKDDGSTATTDGDGIHLNESERGLVLRRYRLDDCREGDFASLWFLLDTLAHELYHYDNHTGLFGSLKKVVQFFLFLPANIALLLSGGRLFTLGKPRSLSGHEFLAYTYAYLFVQRLRAILSDVCAALPDCMPCCERHKAQIEAALYRQEYFLRD
jgi:hypothetical protein